MNKLDSMRRRFFNIVSAVAILSLMGCENLLEEDVFSEMDSSKMFSTQTGVERVLFNAYDYAAINGNFGGNIQFQEEWVCDQFWETGGAVNQQYVPMSNFSFDASYPGQWTTLWNRFYKAVRDCNLVLENIDSSPVSEETKKLMKAEARFIRASVYFKMHSLWGTVPMRLSTTVAADLKKCTTEEIEAFIENEMSEASVDLPERGEMSGYQYGRATKGAAHAYLCKHYLQTRQWQKAADIAKEIIDSKVYELWPDYTTLFTVENEQKNKEFIWVYGCSALGTGNQLMNGAFPADFKSTADGKITFLPNMRNWARMDRVWDSFYNSYDPADKRLGLYVTSYYNSKGVLVDLTGKDNIRLFKYTPDINAVANDHGNDIPVFRLADIILARAEALNELNGPSQEVLDLLQEVRDRAGLTDKLSLGTFTKESLRDRIFQERSWELAGENHRREDLIRQGKFIEVAKARALKQYGESVSGKIDEHFLVFPIPQTEIDANKLCRQNDGY